MIALKVNFQSINSARYAIENAAIFEAIVKQPERNSCWNTGLVLRALRQNMHLLGRLLHLAGKEHFISISPWSWAAIHNRGLNFREED